MSFNVKFQNRIEDRSLITFVVFFLKVTEIYGGEGKVKIKKKNKVSLWFRIGFLVRKRSRGFRRTFTVAFILLSLVCGGGGFQPSRVNFLIKLANFSVNYFNLYYVR